MAAGLLVVAVGMLSTAPVALGAGSSSQRATVRAINLHAADVPGFKSQRGGGGGGSPFGPQINSTCSGLVGGGHRPGVADASSPLFMKSSGLKSEEVQSQVAIEHSRRIVSRDLGVGRSTHTRVCIKRVLEMLTFNEQGTSFTLTDVRVTPLHVAVPGTDGSFGLRIRAAVSALSIRIPFSIDFIGLAVGRDEISLLTEGTAGKFPRKTEQQLSQLLVNRALALPH